MPRRIPDEWIPAEIGGIPIAGYGHTIQATTIPPQRISVSDPTDITEGDYFGYDWAIVVSAWHGGHSENCLEAMRTSGYDDVCICKPVHSVQVMYGGHMDGNATNTLGGKGAFVHDPPAREDVEAALGECAERLKAVTGTTR